MMDMRSATEDDYDQMCARQGIENDHRVRDRCFTGPVFAVFRDDALVAVGGAYPYEDDTAALSWSLVDPSLPKKAWPALLRAVRNILGKMPFRVIDAMCFDCPSHVRTLKRLGFCDPVTTSDGILLLTRRRQ